jgi:FecR-like protein
MSKLRYLIAAVALCAASASAQDPTPAATAAGAPAPLRAAGKVVLVEGDTRFLDASGASRRPKVGDPLHEGERVVTGADGEVHLSMEDGGYIGVRPDTDLGVVTFKADGGADDGEVLYLVKGSFRTITGWIGKAGAAVVRTFDATIGIRGTDHEPLVVPAGAARGEPGTYDRVYIGATVIENAEGSVELHVGQSGFAPRGDVISPERLAIVPSLFQPTRNEGRFDGLHDKIHAQLDKLRQERASDRPAKVERSERPDRAERPEKAERPERAQRPDKPDKPERPRK